MAGKLKKISRSVIENKYSQSLFVRYFTVSILIIIVCFSILGLALLVFVGNYWKNEKTQIIRTNVLDLASTTGDVLSSNRMKSDTEGSLIMLCYNLRTVSRAVGADFFIVNSDGQVAICQESLVSDYLKTDEETGDIRCSIHSAYKFSDTLLNEVNRGNYCQITNLSGMLDDKFIVAAEPIEVNDETVAYCFCLQPLEQGVNTYVFDILKMFLFSSAVALVLCFIAVYLMTYSLTKPLRQMSYATKRYSVGDFSPRVDVRGRDELASLCAEFNAMATALATLESSRRNFVANVSHELKTPMTTISGYMDAILDGTIEKSEQTHYIQIVSDEVKRLSRLVVAMLNMSKIEAGEIKLNPTKFDINELIFTTLLSFEQVISNKNIEITGLEKLSPVEVKADRDMLHQVVYNLVDNAVKFTPENGEISLSAVADEKNVSVSIKNTGAGVSSEEITKIFERFYKVDKSRSYDVKGAGLGLYIVKTIVEMHGGTIRADSVEGQYTNFTFTIPVGGF
ncbi:MAG: HAMP domain-containing protein [Ruminococcaceae bacterium]|jgi:signal transduction histidine kinase|nr:HAMP domain-containing protein [Oscillospiraceae bacterium]